MNPTVTIRCPHCGTIRSGNTMRNSQFTCKGCGAIIHVDNNGNVSKTKPRN